MAPAASKSKSVSPSKTNKDSKAKASSSPTKAATTKQQEERVSRARKTDKGKNAAAAQESQQDKAIFSAFMKPDHKPSSPLKLGLGFAMPLGLNAVNSVAEKDSKSAHKNSRSSQSPLKQSTTKDVVMRSVSPVKNQNSKSVKKAATTVSRKSSPMKSV